MHSIFPSLKCALSNLKDRSFHIFNHIIPLDSCSEDWFGSPGSKPPSLHHCIQVWFIPRSRNPSTTLDYNLIQDTEDQPSIKGPCTTVQWHRSLRKYWYIRSRRKILRPYFWILFGSGLTKIRQANVDRKIPSRSVTAQAYTAHTKSASIL